MEENSDKKKPDLPFNFRKPTYGPAKIADNWHAVQTAISVREKSFDFRHLYAYAAAIAFIALSVTFILLRKSSDNIHTSYGELRTVTLPDSSLVVLNSNSTLEISKNWNSSVKREVRLIGEAFFEITKKPGKGNAKFIVHTAKGDIEVLGTKFNVNTNNDNAYVALKEGRVAFIEKAPERRRRSVILKPGDVVSLKAQPSVKSGKDVSKISAWVHNSFYFDNTPLSEIKKMIENKYGYKVIVADRRLYHKRLSGHLKAASIKEFTKALEVTLNVNIEIGKDQLTIKAR